MTPEDPPDTDATWLYVAIALPFVAGLALIVWHLVDPRPIKSEPWNPPPKHSTVVARKP